MLEVMRRAAHDWILYRHSTRLAQRQIAEEAFIWLFKEKPGDRNWVERALNGKEMTSFLGICEVIGVDPDQVRHYIKRLTVKEILSTGRPPTYRRQKERKRKPVIALLPSGKRELTLPAVSPLPPSSIILLKPRLTAPVSAPVMSLFQKAQSMVEHLSALLRSK
jgi:hypothetical protein